jgi:hypothetical protein
MSNYAIYSRTLCVEVKLNFGHSKQESKVSIRSRIACEQIPRVQTVYSLRRFSRSTQVVNFCIFCVKFYQNRMKIIENRLTFHLNL